MNRSLAGALLLVACSKPATSSTAPSTPSKPPSGKDARGGNAARSKQAVADLGKLDDNAFARWLVNDLGFEDVEQPNPHLFVFTMDDAQVGLLREEAALQFYWTTPSVRCELAAINRWNQTHRLSRAYLDEEGDPALSSELLLAHTQPEDVTRIFIGTFAISLDLFRDHLVENCRLLDGETEQ